MSRKTLVPLNLLTATADPSTPTLRAGDSYYNTSTNTLLVYTGSAWTSFAALNNANTFTASQTVTSLVVTGSTVPTNGVYLPAANTLGLATNSTEKMRITSTGLVGINATPSGTQLQVTASSGSVGINVIGSSTQGYIQTWRDESNTLLGSFDYVGALTAKTLNISGGGGTYAAGVLYSDSNWGMILRAKQANPGVADFSFRSASDAERMRIDSAGLIGINATPSGTQLQVTAATSTVGVTVTGAASTDIQRWISSGAVTVAKIDSAGHFTIEGVTSTGATGTGKFVFDTAPTFTTSVTVSAANIITDTTTGTKIGTATNQKLGFFNATPIVQPASPAGNTSVGTAGATNTVYRNTTFTGGSGTTAYTIGDVVLALKNLGLIAA